MNKWTSLNWAEGDESLVYEYTHPGWAVKTDLGLGCGGAGRGDDKYTL